MKASEHIRQLQAAIAEHGDREVTVFDERSGREHAICADLVFVEEAPEGEARFHFVVQPD